MCIFLKSQLAIFLLFFLITFFCPFVPLPFFPIPRLFFHFSLVTHSLITCFPCHVSSNTSISPKLCLGLLHPLAQMSGVIWSTLYGWDKSEVYLEGKKVNSFAWKYEKLVSKEMQCNVLRRVLVKTNLNITKKGSKSNSRWLLK